MSDVKPTVVVDRPMDRRVVVYAQTKRKVSPREWIVNGEHLPSTTVFDVKLLCDDLHRYVAVVECARGVEVAVGRDLGHMWSVFVSKYGAVDGECVVTADVVECADRSRANALRGERLGELRAQGKQILADKFVRRGSNIMTRARNARTAWVCVDTGEVFASVRQAADAHGLTDRQVFGAVRYHTGRAGGLTWHEVPVDGLDAAGRAAWEAALTRLAGSGQR